MAKNALSDAKNLLKQKSSGITLESLHNLLKSLPVPHPTVAQQLMQSLMTPPQPNPNGVGTNYGPFYTEPGLASVGGSMQSPLGQFGGTLGVDNGVPFGNANMNGSQFASFGPQGY